VDTETFIYCRGWSEAKPGHDGDQNQDAFETRLVGDAAGGSVLLAICDGASSTIGAGPWARALVAAAEPDWPNLDDDMLTMRLDTVRERFQLALPADLPWPVSHKLSKHGSQATFLVASFTRTPDSDEIHLRTVAVGDSALIVFRHDGSTATFPLAKSTDFGTSPRLVSTKPQPGLRYERWDATLMPGDVLIGCTDAVGKWTLESVESADRIPFFRMLLGLLGDGGLPEPDPRPAGASLFGRIADSNTQRRLGEDDLTLVLCVPQRPQSARAPLDFAHEVLEGHLTGNFEHLSRPVSARPTAMSRAWRAIRAALRTVVNVWPSRWR
jgi:hypothetical protein